MLQIKANPSHMTFIQIFQGRVLVVPLYCGTDNFSVDTLGTVVSAAGASHTANVLKPLDNGKALAVPVAHAALPAAPLLPVTPEEPAKASSVTALLSSVDPPASRVVLSERIGPSRLINEDSSDDEIPWRIHKPSRTNWERYHKLSRSNWERIGPSATTARKSSVNRYPKQTARKSTFNRSMPIEQRYH